MSVKLKSIRDVTQKYVFTRAWLSLPELKNLTSFSYFSKPEPKQNLISKDCQNPNSKKTQKLKLDQIHFRNVENVAKKDALWPNFGQNFLKKLVKSKTLRILSEFS